MRVIATAIAVLAAALAGCGGGGSETSAIPSGGGDDAAPAATTAAEPAEPAEPAAPEGCRAVDQPEPKPDGGQKRPSGKLDPAKTWTATVQTNCGTFAFRLDVEKAPRATASIASLANKRFYDGTVFHRIVPGFVFQGGDPTATGSGGPGYTTVDRPPRDAKYTSGVVAMAKGGTEPAGAAGSQFFVVTGKDAQLPPDYAVVGRVVKGDATVHRIGELGNAQEQPTAVVVIERMRVKGSG